MDISTRIGLGGTALFTLAGVGAPIFTWWVSGPIMAVCALVAGWGFWPLFGGLKWRRQKIQTVDTLSADWPIRELFGHIRPDLPLTSSKTVGVATTNDLDDRWKPIGDEVIKQLSVGKLHATGRKEAHRPIRHLAPAPIPQSYWQSAKFSFYFLDQNGKHQEHVVNDEGVRYSDLEINRAEALAIWPLEPWPNFKKWDKKEKFELYEAACLWFNIEPRLPMPDHALSKYQKWREMAFGGGLPVDTDSVRHAVEIGANKESAITPHTRIRKEVLEGLAEHEGYQPMFLYPHQRGEQ
jgi:hypothetical protein